MRDPHKAFGVVRLCEISPTILSTDYKSPHLVIEPRKRKVDENTPIAVFYPLGHGRYALNAIDGVACTLTVAHHYAGNITHPRQGFREMGVLEVYDDNDI